MLDASTLPAEVRALLPDSFELAMPPQGETSDVAFAVGRGSADIVIKRVEGPLYAEWLTREATVLRALGRTEIPVPAVVGEFHDKAQQTHWLLMSRVRGGSVWPMLLAADVPERRALLLQLGSLLGLIHATPPPAVFSEDATPWLDRHRLCASEFAFEEDPLLTTLGEATGGVRTLIHGDFTLDNVLYDQRRPSGVIDWSGAGVGDPRFDITLALATAPELALGPQDLASFFEGYLSADLPAQLRALVRSVYGVG